MADCQPIANVFARIINRAWRLSGGTNRVLSGGESQLAIDLLNDILGVWSGQNSMLFYNTSLEFTVQESKTDYLIGLGDNADFITNPYNDIRSLNYNIGTIDYAPDYWTPKAFNRITYKDIVSYPGAWTFEEKQNSTLLRLMPKPPANTIVKINGQQRLADVTRFQSDSAIPDKAVMFLTYMLANELSAYTPNNPQPNFQQNFNMHYRMFTSSTKIDYENELTPAFYPGINRPARGDYI